jgi:hypothetical protein
VRAQKNVEVFVLVPLSLVMLTSKFWKRRTAGTMTVAAGGYPSARLARYR